MFATNIKNHAIFSFRQHSRPYQKLSHWYRNCTETMLKEYTEKKKKKKNTLKKKREVLQVLCNSLLLLKQQFPLLSQGGIVTFYTLQ